MHTRNRKGRLKPLVAVSAPRIGRLHAEKEVPVLRAGVGPQPERAVDVDPGIVLMGQAHELLERVERHQC